MLESIVFVVEGLLPRHTYSYVAQRLRDTSVIDVSSPVQATSSRSGAVMKRADSWSSMVIGLRITASGLRQA